MADVCCPYCGNTQSDPARCEACGGLFEPLSRQATQLAMGPWFVRDEAKPFMPGFSAEVLKHQVMAGRIKPQTPVRGPTTHQFWMPAIEVPGVSRLLGKCHACGAAVAPHAKQCPKCEAGLMLPEAVDRLGLAYTTEEERAVAEAAIAQGRGASPPPPRVRAASPTPATPARPTGPGAAPHTNANAGAAALRPIPDGLTSEHDPTETLGPAPHHATSSSQAMHDDSQTDETGEHDPHDIEAIWSDTPTRRRRKKRGGPDPMIIGVGVVLLVGLFVAGFFAMQAASNQHEEKLAELTPGGGVDGGASGTAAAQQPDPQPQSPQRTEDAVISVRDQAMPRVDQLKHTTIPDALAEPYAALLGLVAEAEAAYEAGEFDQAFRAYREIGQTAGALDSAVYEHMEQLDARGQAEALRTEAENARQEAMADDAMRWAPPDWALAEEAFAAGEAALAGEEIEQLIEAQREFRRAVSDYQFARSQASRGFLAVQAGDKLERAMTRTFSMQELQTFGGEAYTDMLDLQRRGHEYLEAFSYYDAQDAFEIAMRRLEQAENGVKRAHGVKFYAFAAGYSATDALISVAAGDGLSEEKREILRETFADLTLNADLISALPEGGMPDYRACAEVLVTQAREAITRELGVEAQLSFHIGFQFRIVQQTLDNPRLSSQQSRRISQSLSQIVELAGQAGYSRELAGQIDTFKATLRGSEDGAGLENARTAWRDLIVTLRTYDSAMPIVNPAASPAPDPELFPS
ncbi:MAG: zinc ribbon domain-containing protein [Phycisphaerales bacterium JB063]